MCGVCSEWARLDEAETPEASMFMMLILIPFLDRENLHLLLEKMVLIFLTNFEDTALTVIGGVHIFSSPIFFFCGHSCPMLLQINA